MEYGKYPTNEKLIEAIETFSNRPVGEDEYYHYTGLLLYRFKKFVKHASKERDE